MKAMSTSGPSRQPPHGGYRIIATEASSGTPSGGIAAAQRSIPIADIEIAAIGNAEGAAHRVRSERCRVSASEVVLSDLNRVIDFDVVSREPRPNLLPQWARAEWPAATGG